MKKIILPVINKVDTPQNYILPTSYYSLKVDLVYISAEHNIGLEDILTRIENEVRVEANQTGEKEKEPPAMLIGMVGKPNVGKSSLINKILNDERVIVTPVPGTTRDSIDLEVRRNLQTFILVDNAGIRKLKKVKEETESAAIIRAEKAMQNADVIIFILDLAKFPDQNDLLIARKIEKAAKPVIIAGNKWDLLDPNTDFDSYYRKIKSRFNSLFFAPFVPISAKTGKNVFLLIDKAQAIQQKLRKRFKTSVVNQTIKDILNRKKLLTVENRPFVPKFVSIETQEPFFLKFFCKYNERLKPTDELFLKKRIVEKLDLEGIPVFFKIVTSK